MSKPKHSLLSACSEPFTAADCNKNHSSERFFFKAIMRNTVFIFRLRRQVVVTKTLWLNHFERWLYKYNQHMLRWENLSCFSGHIEAVKYPEMSQQTNFPHIFHSFYINSIFLLVNLTMSVESNSFKEKRLYFQPFCLCQTTAGPRGHEGVRVYIPPHPFSVSALRNSPQRNLYFSYSALSNSTKANHHINIIDLQGCVSLILYCRYHK